MPVQTRRPTDVLVLDTKTLLMQAVQRSARHGYYWATCGEVPVAKLAAFVRKMTDLYLVSLGYAERHKRKLLGLGNARLLLWQQNAPQGVVSFVLLVSQGDHAARTLERLCDMRARDQRIELRGYELVQHQRRDSRRNASWTWRMTRATYDGWRQRILDVARRGDMVGLRQAWFSLHSVPGFGGARSQVRVLVRLFRAEVRRRNSGLWPLSPMRNRYVEFLRVTGRPPSAVSAQDRATHGCDHGGALEGEY